MKLSLAFTAVVIFFLNIPPFEARPRPLGLGAHPSRHYQLNSEEQQRNIPIAGKEEHLRLSPLPRPGAAGEAGEAALVSYEPGRRSGDAEEEAVPGTPPDDELRRSAAHSPPAQERNPAHYRQPAGRWGPVPGVGGSRKPSRPPAPGVPKPPHWRRSGDRSGPRPRPFDVFHALRVWSRMFV
ncbi:hypothetical protein VPH35_023627 [Triticum aestivum]